MHIGQKRKRLIGVKAQEEDSEHDFIDQQNSSPTISIKLNEQQEADLIRELEQ